MSAPGWAFDQITNGKSNSFDVLIEDGTHIVLVYEPTLYVFKMRLAFTSQFFGDITDQQLRDLDQEQVRKLVGIAYRAHLHDARHGVPVVPNTRGVIRRLA